MGRGILQAQLCRLEEIGERVEEKSAWQRRKGFNLTYGFGDALKSAFGLFFFQHLSMLSYQESLELGNRRKNAENMLNVKEIPCNNQIKRLVDVIEPKEFTENFKAGVEIAQKTGVFEQYKVLKDVIPIAIDGVSFQSSEKTHCSHCLHITKDGKTKYYHSMVAAVIVHPASNVVLPLMPEMIRNDDKPQKDAKTDKPDEKVSYENQKQDCERTAAKRLLEKHGDYYKELNAMLLGDDLYANYNTCKDILDRELSFLFTCKDESHPWIAEQFKYSEPETLKITEWNGRNQIEYRYKWVNGLENRADGDVLLVNYIYFETYNVEKDKITYKNSWVTDKLVTKVNVKELVECGRARWKIENENNNVLKNYGYHLEHNFGHGEKHACEIFCVLNILAFLVHGLMVLCDENFIKARSYLIV